MRIPVHVRLSGNFLEVLGGAAGGKDALHQLISTWAGWSRRPAAAPVPTGAGSSPGGGRCSIFFARLWPAAIVPLLESKVLEIDWEGISDPSL